MSYDQEFFQRVRAAIGSPAGLVEKKMFGGVAFLLNGNMALGVLNRELIVRFGPERQAEMAQKPHTRPFDLTGRAMKGWLMVAADGCEKDADLNGWVAMSLQYAAALPAK